MVNKFLRTALKYGSLILWSLLVCLPLLTVFFGSFMTQTEFEQQTGLALPASFLHVSNYRQALVQGQMVRGFLITFVLLFFGVLGTVFLASMVAYVLERFEFRGKKLVVGLYFLVSMVPLTLAQVATFKLITSMGIYNTVWAPILLYLGADVMMIYIYRQGIRKIPRELDKMALLEGASYGTIYRQIIFPLLRPATGTVIMLKVISIYNDFYLPYLYMPSSKLNTIATTVYRFTGPNQTQWPVICAAVVISMLPMVLLYLFLQKTIGAGMSGGIKG